MRLYPFKIFDDANRAKYDWFAWYPVKTNYGVWVVFEVVERHGYIKDGKWIYGYYRKKSS